MICHYIVHHGPCLAFREEIKQRGVTGDDAGSCPCKGLELGSFMVQLNQNLADVARQLVCKKVNGSKRL